MNFKLELVDKSSLYVQQTYILGKYAADYGYSPPKMHPDEFFRYEVVSKCIPSVQTQLSSYTKDVVATFDISLISGWFDTARLTSLCRYLTNIYKGTQYTGGIHGLADHICKWYLAFIQPATPMEFTSTAQKLAQDIEFDSFKEKPKDEPKEELPPGSLT